MNSYGNRATGARRGPVDDPDECARSTVHRRPLPRDRTGDGVAPRSGTRDLRVDRRRLSASALRLRAPHDRQPRGRRGDRSGRLRPRVPGAGQDGPAAAGRAAPAALALHDHPQRHPEPPAVEAADQRRARRAGRPRRAPQRDARRPRSARSRSSTGPPTWCWSSRPCCSCPMHLRAAATLRFIEGRSHPEIAEILNQPIGTVKSHVHRAVRILRRILGPQVGRIVPSDRPATAEEEE